MNIISTNITTYPLGCSCQIFFKCFFVEVTDDVGLIPISVLKNHQAKLPPAAHISAEELEQEHRLQWLDSLIKEEEKAEFSMILFMGCHQNLGISPTNMIKLNQTFVMDGISTNISANLGIRERTNWDCIGIRATIS
jgi:hypothetical protein